MKRFLKLFLSVAMIALLLSGYAVGAFASEKGEDAGSGEGSVLTTGLTTTGDTTTIGASSSAHVDGGAYLTAGEISAVEETLNSIAEKNGLGIFVVFTDYTFADSSKLDDVDAARDEIRNYADKLLREKAAGQDGILLLVAFVDENHRYHVIEKDTDRLSKKFVENLEKTDSAVTKKLSNGEYAEASKAFADEIDKELNPNILKALWWRFLAALGIGGAATGVAVGVHKGNAKTRKRHYLKDNSIHVLEKNERLEGTETTTRELKPAKDDNKNSTF